MLNEILVIGLSFSVFINCLSFYLFIKILSRQRNGYDRLRSDADSLITQRAGDRVLLRQLFADVREVNGRLFDLDGKTTASGMDFLDKM